MLVLLISVMMAACSETDDTTTQVDKPSTETTDEGTAEESGSELSGEITVWAHPFTQNAETEKAMWDEIIKNYEAETGVKVTFEQIPWANRDQKILTALVANNGPDVFYVIPDQMPQYANEGMLLELNQYVDTADLEDFVDTALVSTTWRDKLYGLPILQEAYTMIYNVDVINAIGESVDNLPKTWEDFTAWSAKAKEKGYTAFSFAGGGSMNGTLYPFIWQAGGQVVTESNEVLINNEAGVEAFTYINEMYKNGYIPQDAITALDHDALWDSGKMLAVLGSGISVSRMLDAGQFEFVLSEPLKNKEQLTYGTTGMFVSPINTDNPAGAAEFIKFVTNTDSQRAFNGLTQYVPTRESAKDIFKDQPYLAQIASYTQYALPGVIHPEGRNIMPLIQAEMQSMLEGNQTPQEAADKAAEAIKGKVQ